MPQEAQAAGPAARERPQSRLPTSPLQILPDGAPGDIAALGDLPVGNLLLALQSQHARIVLDYLRERGMDGLTNEFRPLNINCIVKSFYC
jgi:hypothetical protein